MMKPDIARYKLMLITDRHRSGGRDNLDVVRDAMRGGVRLFQLREPDLPDGEIYNIAKSLLAEIGVGGELHGLLILNDRVDVCIAAGADGVHLGANDLPIDVARRLLGDERLIGFSAHTREQAMRAVSEGADYVTLSPAFPLKHKESAFEPHTPDELWGIADEIGIPTFFLGGITKDNLGGLMKAGKQTRIAVVSAITSADDIQSAAMGLTAILKK